jgi:hypothetical protein
MRKMTGRLALSDQQREVIGDALHGILLRLLKQPGARSGVPEQELA